MISMRTMKNVICAGLLATVWIPGVATAQKAGVLAAPRLRPKVQIPPMKQAPTIDGVLTEGEWPTLHVARWVGSKGDYLAERDGEFWLGTDGQKLYVAVRTVVHPTLGVVTQPAEQPADEAEEEAEEEEAEDEQLAEDEAEEEQPEEEAAEQPEREDVERLEEVDSIEIWVSNNERQFQIMVNSAGDLYDVLNEYDSDVGGNAVRREWTAGISQAHRVEDGLWVAEVAIDLDSLALEDIKKLLLLRVCRNFQKPKEQCRWAPKVNYFSAPATMPAIVFDERAPIVSETGFQDVDGIRMGVDVTNPGEEPLSFEVRLTTQVNREEPGVLEKSIQLLPGQTERVEAMSPLTEAQKKQGVAFGEIRVRSAKGGTYYHRDVRWRLDSTRALWEE